MKKIYFLSDAHLGSRAITYGRKQERRLVAFLDSVKEDAAAIYLLGDMFDFWFEYRTVVPKGFTRFLGKLSELSDSGVEVHYFTGNHDLWCGDYLMRECGVMIHREPYVTMIYGKEFYLAHGDGLGDPDKKYRFLRCIFHNVTLQKLFAAIHPRWAVDFGLTWAKHSRYKRENGEELPYQGQEGEYLVRYSKRYLETHPQINYFIYGHRHIELDLMVTPLCRVLLLGEWIQLCTYAEYDGTTLTLKRFVEG